MAALEDEFQPGGQTKLHLAVDVHYSGDDQAVAAGIAFSSWTSPEMLRSAAVRIANVQPYLPGRFYERELPCVLALLENFNEPLETIVVDGYVTLGAEQSDGLGAHLFNALHATTPIIGVAKSRFEGTPPECELLRGGSKRPLFVTSRGMALEEAKRLIASMHGAHRIPTVLSAVDHLCRNPPA